MTDAVQQVSQDIPKIFLLDDAAKKPLLYHARDGILDRIDPSSIEQLQKGWRRVQLFGLYFMPAAIDIHSVPQSWKERRPDVNPDFAGIYPWDWVRDDVKAFRALSGDSKDALYWSRRSSRRSYSTEIRWRRWTGSTACVGGTLSAWSRRTSKIISRPGRRRSGGPSPFSRSRASRPASQKPRRDDLQTLLDAEKSLEAMGAIAANRVGLEDQ